MRTLGQQVVLARTVRKLHISFPSAIPWPDDIMQNALAAARSRLELPEEIGQHWSSTPADRRSDAATAFLVALTPNIELLILGIPARSPLISAVFRSAIDAQPYSGSQAAQGPSMPAKRFACLREIRVKPAADAPYALSVGRVKELFSLLALETFRGSQISWTQEDGLHEFVMSDVSSGLRHVYLEAVYIRVSGISSLLSHCPELKPLRLEVIVSASGLDYEALGQELRVNGKRLETLDMDFDYPVYDDEFSGSDEPEIRQNGRIGPLKDLHQLKHLSIPHQILVGPEFSGSETGPLGPGRKCPPLKLLEAVPDSLETLYLYSRSGDDDHHIAEELCGMIKSRKPVKLRQIGVDKSLSLPEDIWASGWEFCRGLGLRLRHRDSVPGV